jgi:hypothetical protein
METVKVPATPGPKKQLCYQTPPLDGSRGNPMVHCDRAINHAGRHSWELDRTPRVSSARPQSSTHGKRSSTIREKMPQDREPMGRWLDERGPLLEKATMNKAVRSGHQMTAELVERRSTIARPPSLATSGPLTFRTRSTSSRV